MRMPGAGLGSGFGASVRMWLGCDPPGVGQMQWCSRNSGGSREIFIRQKNFVCFSYPYTKNTECRRR